MTSKCNGINVSQFLHRPLAIDSTRLDEVALALRHANENAQRGSIFTKETDIVGLLLGTLSLTGCEFELAQSRLQNANRYAISGEFGAAKWELNALSEWLSPYILVSSLH